YSFINSTNKQPTISYLHWYSLSLLCLTFSFDRLHIIGSNLSIEQTIGGINHIFLPQQASLPAVEEQEKLRQNARTMLSIIQRTKVQLIELRPTINDEADQKLK
ncbi:unnamed protein product, partial [Rotaria sordida]